MAEVSLVNLPLDECYSTLLMISQHWFRWWLSAVRQQAITWVNVDPDLCRHMVSLGHSELTTWQGTRIVVPVMATRLTIYYSLSYEICASFCCALFCHSCNKTISEDSHDVFTHTLQGYFTGNSACEVTLKALVNLTGIDYCQRWNIKDSYSCVSFESHLSMKYLPRGRSYYKAFSKKPLAECSVMIG